MTETAAVLDVRDLVTAFFYHRRVPVPVVDGLSLRVERGETVGLVGESGCGKTLTALSIMKLLPVGASILSGRILLDGCDVVSVDERRMRRVRGQKVALISQDPMTSLTPTMTVGQQVAEAVRVHRGGRGKRLRPRVIELLHMVGLAQPVDRLASYPHQLSGGQRQRVMIAMALACEPQLLIADEPTTALDVTIQAQILHLLDDLKGRLGMSVLLITHDMGVIAQHADRVAIMYAGKIVEEATTQELFASPRHPYTEALLASIPRADQEAGEPLFTIAGLPPDSAALPPGCHFSPRCRYATGHCQNQEPALTDPASTGHRFACHHPLGGDRPVSFAERSP